MALVKPVVFQVVGYQNSGKTTFTNKMIQILTAKGIKSAAIKHHGHGGKPDILEEKDSSSHIVSGALAAIVEGDGRLLLQAEGKEYGLEDQIKLLSFFQPDVILIEGYKFAEYPKLILLRNAADIALLQKVKNIRAIVYWQEEIKNHLEGIGKPCFSIYDETAVSFVVNCLATQTL